MASQALFLQQYEVVQDVDYPPGGFGVVQSCRSLANPEERLVVKTVNYANAKRFLQAGPNADPRSPMKEFTRELELLDIFHDHPLFCQAVGWFWEGENDDMRIVMKRYETDLYTVILDQRKVLSHFEAQTLFNRIAQAVKAMHEQELIHRDLKLENVFLDNAQDMGSAVLADFGCARRLPSDKQVPTSIIGTRSFWPPEMLEGLGRYNLPLDIWQLGCMFFTCVAFYYPFGEDVKQGFRQRVMAGTFAAEDVPDAFPHLRDLIQRCLAVGPANRPTIDEVLAHPFFSG
eukprot:m.47968 g.47968  ORF g.47968 m.47968 type:complete len:288 (+) comp13257_c0_seq1:113-976(+)